MKIVKTAVLLTGSLCFSGAALAVESAKAGEQIIEVEIQSEPMRISAAGKKPGPSMRSNTRMSASVAQIGADGKVTIDCESHHVDSAVQQLQVEPR